MAKFEMKWDAPEYETHEKDVSWYWTSIIVAALIVAFSVFEKNFLFGFFIVIAEILFIVWGSRVARIIRFDLTDQMLTIDDKKSFLMKDFESVSIDPLENGWVDLIFIFRPKLRTPLKVLLPETRVEELRTNLKGVLKEVPHDPTFLDSIEKLLRF